MMVSAHKKGGEKLSENTGYYVLFSGVLCVLFYTEILPFFSSLVNSHGLWCMAQSAPVEAGFLHHQQDILWVVFGLSLSHAISRMKAQQTALVHTL